MQMGRVACGIVAGVVGLVLMFTAQAVEMRLFGSTRKATLYLAFFGGGGAVLWLADHFGLMARPFTEPTLGLHGPANKSENEHQEHEDERL